MKSSGVTDVQNLDRADFAAPSGSKLVGELAAVAQLPRLLRKLPAGFRSPRGSASVLLLPGYGTDDRANLPLRAALSALGHSVSGWGLGRNRGDVEGDLPAVIERAERLSAAADAELVLIGWSLGGVFARELARDRPDLVARVITYGTPVVGGPRFTRSAAAYGEARVAAIEALVDQRNETPIARPVTAFYSRSDGIVDWRACIDSFSPDVENIEVRSTHVGMTIDPDVWSTIARRLAS